MVARTYIGGIIHEISNLRAAFANFGGSILRYTLPFNLAAYRAYNHIIAFIIVTNGNFCWHLLYRYINRSLYCDTIIVTTLTLTATNCC